MLLAAAMLLSYIEVLIQPGALIPVPGFKLGLANITVMFALYYAGTAEAASVGALRVLLSALLFGSVPSLIFSATGFVFAFGAALVCRYAFPGSVSVVGASVAAAAFHSTGQICAAALMLGGGVFGYLPWLLFASALTGLVNGLAAKFTGERLRAAGYAGGAVSRFTKNS